VGDGGAGPGFPRFPRPASSERLFSVPDAENPYVSPSLADDGTIVAARKGPSGGPLYRMRQNGELLNTIPIAPVLAGPFAPQVSPDGRLVAYEHVFSKNVNGYIETSSDVRFTRTDGSTPQGIGPETGRGPNAPRCASGWRSRSSADLNAERAPGWGAFGIGGAGSD
jgi:hypothetical protein